MSFCTAINCMDGRAQLPVITFLKKRFDTLYVDVVSEPGPSLILSEGADLASRKSILRRVDISINVHKSRGIAIVAHADCAGNPGSKDKQIADLRSSMDYLMHKYPSLNIIAVWLNDKWEVEEILPS